jgi:hypothetical protein
MRFEAEPEVPAQAVLEALEWIAAIHRHAIVAIGRRLRTYTVRSQILAMKRSCAPDPSCAYLKRTLLSAVALGPMEAMREVYRAVAMAFSIRLVARGVTWATLTVCAWMTTAGTQLMLDWET